MIATRLPALLLLWCGLGCAVINRYEPRRTAAELVQPTAQPVSRLRVVTYNVYGQPLDKVATTFESSPLLRGADLVALQEIEDPDDTRASGLTRMAARLGMGYVYAPGYGLRSGGTHGVALLSRLPLVDVRVIELPRVWVVFNSARRIAIAATARWNGGSVRVYVVHLDNRLTPAQRKRQLAAVLEDGARHPLPMIVAGDFNTGPFCWFAHVVPFPCGGAQARGLESFVRKRGLSTPTATSGPTSQYLDMRLDAIYTRGLEVYERGVVRTVRLSDHFPLWVEMRLPGR